MKKYLFGIGLLVLIGLTTACKKDENDDSKPGEVALTFNVFDGSDEIGLNTPFVNADGYPVTIQNIRFYLSNIRLIKSSGESVKLSDIDFFDIKDHKTSAQYTVPAGKYDYVAFDLGVPADLNSPDNPDFLVSAYANNHPLSESNGMFWGWEPGYRFFTIDGHCDTVPNSSDVLPLSLSIHTGRDTLFREVPSIYHPVTIQSERSTVLAFGIDLETFFHHDEVHIDLADERQFHGEFSQMALGIKAADNSEACFKPVE